MSRPAARRSGFTLVELMVVILVIGVLASVTFGLFKAANDSRNKAKSRGDIQALSMACQSYRKTYGDFPGCATGTDARYRRDLFDQLIGRRVIRMIVAGTPPALLPFDDATLPGGANRQQRSFLSFDDISSNDNAAISANDWRSNNAASREFIDAWGNPYDYRYRVLLPGRYTEWRSPNFLAVSCGVKFIATVTEGEPPLAAEYWDPTGGPNAMSRSGFVPATYFDENADNNGPFRADNIVNWSN